MMLDQPNQQGEMAVVPSPDNQTTTLTDAEQRELAECERRIDDGLSALWEIKTKRLYRAMGDFSDYMRLRWGRTARSGNYQVAAYSAILVLRDQFEGTDVPLPSTEYVVRPIASLGPEQMRQVYEVALTLSDGALPTHDVVETAKTMTLDEKRIEAARLQVLAGAYDHLKAEALNGGNPIVLLALADTLDACEPPVRAVIVRANVRDRALIRRLNELHRQRRDTASEILTTGYLQFADGTARKLADATARDLQRLTDERWREHQQAARDASVGTAVSIVVYNKDAEATLKSLKAVLSYSTLVKLADLIGGL